MPSLPAHPDLDQLRRQAKELLRAGQAGDADAIARIRAVSDTLTLGAAQLAVAREYGFASWPRLTDEVDVRRLDNGGTALHAAAYNGSTQTVRLLLDRGAEIEVRDTNWNDTPLGWAAVGSGERPRTNKAANWIETVRTLLGHGASTDEITLEPDDPKPPSPEVADLLKAHVDHLPPQ